MIQPLQSALILILIIDTDYNFVTGTQTTTSTTTFTLFILCSMEPLMRVMERQVILKPSVKMKKEVLFNRG
jgi:hypothetical protein